MTEWVAIQRNPTSGSGPKAGVLKQLITGLKQHGLKPRLFSHRDRLQRLLAEPHRRESLRCIVAAGGDGTVGDVINRHPGLPVAVCPLGTENLIAKYLGIPRKGGFVAEMIAAGRKETFDACTLNAQQRFAIMVSAGFDADIVHRTDARRSGHIHRWSYARPIWDALRRYEFPPLRVFVDGSEEPLRGVLVLAANLPMYAMRLPVANSAVGNDGLLDVRLFERPSSRQMLRYMWKIWRGRHEQLADVKSFRATSLRIESDVPVPMQIDGDPAGFTPAEICIIPAALQLFVPQTFSAR